MKILISVLGIPLVVSIVILLISCDQQPTQSISSTGIMPARTIDQNILELGKNVFKENCAQCHGEQAQGDKNWRQRDDQGYFQPPPLNGSGHAWHHSRQILKQVIEDGSVSGQGNMPGWKSKLSDTEIEAVISWFQSLWPDEVYAAWYEMQQRN